MSSRKLKLLKASRLKTLSQNSFIRYCTTVLNIQPFESIPGPPGNGLPFIGHSNLYTKKPAGIGKTWENLKDIKKQYLNENDKLMRLNLPPFNLEGKGRFLLLLDPNDVELAYRNEGKFPNR